MKKLQLVGLLMLTAFVMTSCKSNDGKYYIDDKITTEGYYKEAKELAEKINDIESVESQVNLNISLENTSLNSFNNESDDDYEDVTDRLFSVTNKNLISYNYNEIEYALETAKHNEKMCFENHIGMINEWEFWGDGNGQVRIVYDKDKKDFMWEKLQNEWERYDEATNKNYFKHDGSKEYRKYITSLNENDKLEISSIIVMFNENNDNIYQQVFDYSEDKSFNQTDYNYTKASSGESTYYYKEVHIGLEENNKYLERIQFSKDLDTNGNVSDYFLSYYTQIYLNDCIVEVERNIIKEFGENTNITVYNYSLEELFQIQENENSTSVMIDIAHINGFSKFMRNKHYEGMFVLYDSDGNAINDISFITDIVNSGYQAKIYIDGDITKANHLFDLKGLGLKTNKKLSYYYDKYEEMKPNITAEALFEKVANVTLYDKKYRDNSMKDSTLPRFRAQNDLECEVKGEVKLVDDVLDLSELTITIYGGEVYKEGNEYKYGCLLWKDNSSQLEFSVIGKCKCENGKVVISNLGKYDISKFPVLKYNKRTSLMLETYDPTAAVKLNLVDIIIDASNGKLNGTPTPVDYNNVDWK